MIARGLTFVSLCLLLPACRAPSIEQQRRTLAEQLRDDSTLLFQLASYDAKERSLGVARVRALGKEQGSLLILYLLQEPTVDNERLEVVLARILADWKDERALGYLLQHLRNPDDGAVRIASEGVLVFRDDPRLVDALGEMLRSPVRRDRYTAANILSGLRGAKVPSILAVAFRKEEDSEIRALLLLGILETRGPERLESLIDALIDQDQAIRREAWAALRDYRSLPEVAYSPDGALEDRARCVAQLRLWQKKHQ